VMQLGAGCARCRPVLRCHPGLCCCGVLVGLPAGTARFVWASDSGWRLSSIAVSTVKPSVPGCSSVWPMRRWSGPVPAGPGMPAAQRPGEAPVQVLEREIRPVAPDGSGQQCSDGVWVSVSEVMNSSLFWGSGAGRRQAHLDVEWQVLCLTRVHRAQRGTVPSV
jgi:hypothetical protein